MDNNHFSMCELMEFTLALGNDLRRTKHRIKTIEETINAMATQNEQAILDLAEQLRGVGQSLGAAISRVEAKLNAPGETTAEDLSEELAALRGAAGDLGSTAARLDAIAPEVAAPAPTEPTDPGQPAPEEPANPIEGQPIDRDNVPETPLAGSSGGTDGVITGDPVPPGSETLNPTDGSGSGSTDTDEESPDLEPDTDEVDEDEEDETV